MRSGDIPDKEIPTADPSEVIKQYEGWLKRLVNRYSGLLADTAAVDTEDMIQAGNMAILEAQKTYNPDAGTSFLSWSYLPIRNAILLLFGYDNPERKRPALPLVYLDEPIDEDGEETRLDCIIDPNCVIPEEKAVQDSAQEEIRTEVRAAVDRLKNDKQREIVKRVWFDGQDKQSLSVDMGISIDSVRENERKGRYNLYFDRKLYNLAYPIFRVGMNKFRSTMTSAVEAAVLWREKEIDNQFGDGSYIASKAIVYKQ